VSRVKAIPSAIPLGENQLPKVVQGVTFTNGVEVTNTPAQNAA
jgi:hypothetical protein